MYAPVVSCISDGRYIVEKVAEKESVEGINLNHTLFTGLVGSFQYSYNGHLMSLNEPTHSGYSREKQICNQPVNLIYLL
jgi:hypothetical protein